MRFEATHPAKDRIFHNFDFSLKPVQDGIKAKKLGIREFLSKPWEIIDMAAAIRRVTEKR